jgi:hypothetical protein
MGDDLVISNNLGSEKILLLFLISSAVLVFTQFLNLKKCRSG